MFMRSFILNHFFHILTWIGIGVSLSFGSLLANSYDMLFLITGMFFMFIGAMGIISKARSNKR